MRELLAVALAFGLMLILLRKNVNFGVTMLITSATLCVVAGIAPLTVFNVIKTTFTSEKNITTLLVVFTVSILGGLCGRYGILTKVVDSMQDIIPNTKVVIMLIPAIIGLLVMPGGRHPLRTFCGQRRRSNRHQPASESGHQPGIPPCGHDVYALLHLGTAGHLHEPGDRAL